MHVQLILTPAGEEDTRFLGNVLDLVAPLTAPTDKVVSVAPSAAKAIATPSAAVEPAPKAKKEKAVKAKPAAPVVDEDDDLDFAEDDSVDLDDDDEDLVHQELDDDDDDLSAIEAPAKKKRGPKPKSEKKAEAKPEAEPAENKAYKLEDVIKAFKEFVANNDREAAGKVLQKYNVKSVRDLAQTDYAKVMKSLKK